MAKNTKNYNEPKNDKTKDNGITEVVFILDRSGSMTGLEADTIGGFNSMLKKQKKEEGEVIWSTVLFDDRHEVVHNRLPIGRIEDEYYTRGCTALLDAIGRAIHHIGMCHRYADADRVPEKTIFVITTDGMENSSREYGYGEIKRMIEKEKEKYGWEFIFLGANMDAVSVASRMGIDASRAATYTCDSRGIERNFDVVGETITAYRHREVLAEDCLEEIRVDHRSRGRSRGRRRNG